MRFDTHGKELVRYVAEVELGPSYGPERGVRLIAATLDPVPLQPESTWYLATALSLSEASPEQVYELSAYAIGSRTITSPPNRNSAGPTASCVRSRPLCATGSWCCWRSPSVCWLGPCRGQARTWPTLPYPPVTRCQPPPRLPPTRRLGEKYATASAGRVVWNGTLRRVRAWLCPWARLQLYWQRWSSGAPPPELAALLAHVASARPLEAPT